MAAKNADERLKPSQSLKLSTIMMFFYIAAGAGLVFILTYASTIESLSISLLWMLACFIVGAGFGFLFSIPKVFQNKNGWPDEVSDGLVYRLHVNSNLTEISDWLTKIIVGLSLVNLTKMPPYFNSISMTLANGIKNNNRASALAFSYGIIVSYSILGFLFAYLFTRLYLSRAISKADQESIAVLKAQVEVQGERIDISTNLLKSSSQSNATPLSGQTLSEKMQKLEGKADQYLNISISNKKERAREKSLSADEMASIALREGITKEMIAEVLRSKFNEGLMITLCTLINLDPQGSDIDTLLELGPNVKRLHVQYRALIAISALQTKNLISSSNKEKLLNLVERYKANADDSLLERINSIILILRN